MNQAYLKVPEIEWDEKTPLCTYMGDEYFYSEDDIFDYCYEFETLPSEMELVHTAEQKFRTLTDDSDWWVGYVEDYELPADLKKLIQEFNEKAALIKSNVYYETNSRPPMDYMKKLDAEYERGMYENL